MAEANITLGGKICCACKQDLPPSNFYKDTRQKDGLYRRCKQCHVQATAEYARRNKDLTAARAQEWRVKNPEKRKAIAARARAKRLEKAPEFESRRMQAYRAAKPDVIKEINRRAFDRRKTLHANELKRYASEYYEKNAETLKSRSKERYHARKELDRPINAERAMRRVAQKRNATPSWANKGAIREIYQRAADLTKLTGVEHQVDHLVPLNSRYVCGLHVEANLEVKPKTDNMEKSNRWWPDCPDHLIEALPETIRRALR